jgi:hypothetical protein
LSRLCQTCITLLILLTVSCSVSARDNIRVDMDGTFLSRFVWRGDMWTDDPVFWQTTTFGYKGFRFYNFFNVDLTDINGDSFQVNEYDFIIDYTFRYRSFSIAPGVLHFSSPTDYFEPSTKIILEIKVFSVMNPRFRVRIDPTGSKGSYFIGSMEQRIALPRLRKTVAVYGSFGMSEPRYYGKGLNEEFAFTDLLLGLSLPFQIYRDYSLSPTLEYTSLLGHNLRNGIKLRERPTEAITYSIRLAKSFDF